MKKYVLLLLLVSGVMSAMEYNNLPEQSLDDKLGMLGLSNKSKGTFEVVLTPLEIETAMQECIEELSIFPSLKSLCIRTVLAYPRNYIEHAHKINRDLQEIVQEKWLRYMKLFAKKGQKTRLLLLGPSSVLREKIPLDQLLLMQSCHIANEQEKLVLTKQENEIFHTMPLPQQQRIKQYIENK